MLYQRVPVTLLLAVALLLTACADDPTTDTTENAGEAGADDADSGQADAAADDADRGQADAGADPQQRYPDVVDAELEADGELWRLSATLSSPYDTPERYADAFRALTPDGEELGVRVLLHDHAGEQPFTRSLEDLQIPDGLDEIIVEGRDLEHGWGGDTVAVPVPR